MYSKIKTDDLKKAGDYTLSEIVVHSRKSFDGSSKAKKTDITSLVAEINIYEDINEKNLSGQLVISDSTGLPNHMPLTGNELLSFKLGTPGSSRYYDFEKHPMVIYKIGSKQPHNPRSQFYVLYFCSKEQITNQTVKVERPFTGAIADMISSIALSELGTSKDITLEGTKGNRKLVVPRFRPFKAIDFLCAQAESATFNNTGFKWYETANGFHCRSFENMMAVGVDSIRPNNGYFKPTMAGTTRNKGNRDVTHEMQTISSYEVIEQFNLMKLLGMGGVASRVLKTDLFNKTFATADFDYEKEYGKNHHTEHDGSGSRQGDKKILPDYPFRDNKPLTAFADGTFFHSSETENQYDGFFSVTPEKGMQNRIAQEVPLESFKVTIEVPGYTGLSVGEMIGLEIPRYESISVGDKDQDEALSGRYLVSSIIHKVLPGKSYHSMTVECMKDSVKTPYYNETIKVEEGNTDKGKVFEQEKIDEGIFGIIS